MSELLAYRAAGPIVTIALNRPDHLNALNGALTEALIEALGRAAGDDAVRCVILTGEGRAFCSGADLSELESAYRSGESVDIGPMLRERYNRVIPLITGMPKPVIAAVNGVAAGAGASLALACDFRIASEKAKFFQAFIKIGLVGDSGANYFLPRIVGFPKAMELAMTGDIIDAQEALRIGLVNGVAAHDELEKAVLSYAEPFASGPTAAYAATKKAMHFGSTHDLQQTLDYEAELQSVLGLTEDHREGVMAFLDKRAPDYKGH